MVCSYESLNVFPILLAGRDHGLAPYNQYRSLCNLTYARDFNDLTREISPPILERLRRTYANVNDIGASARCNRALRLPESDRTARVF